MSEEQSTGPAAAPAPSQPEAGQASAPAAPAAPATAQTEAAAQTQTAVAAQPAAAAQGAVATEVAAPASVPASVAAAVSAPNAPAQVTQAPTRPLELLHGVEMSVSVELGRTRMFMRDLLGLRAGGIVELDRAAGSPVDLLVNGTLLARGEVVVVEDELGVRITEIVGQSTEET